MHVANASEHMGFSRTAKYLSVGAFGALMLSPLWAFEALCCYGVHGENLPAATEQAPSVMQDALWLASGEELGTRVEAVWAGNFFWSPRQPSRGRAAANSIAHHIVFRNHEHTCAARSVTSGPRPSWCGSAATRTSQS